MSLQSLIRALIVPMLMTEIIKSHLAVAEGAHGSHLPIIISPIIDKGAMSVIKSLW